jgi:hypothetical protein
MQCRSSPARRIFVTRTSAFIASVLLGVTAFASHAQDKPPPLRKYVGSPDYPALLKDPVVQPKLQAVVGKQLPALMRNISVSGGVDLVAGALSVNGIAPHKRGEEEGVICVNEFNGTVQAAIVSKGRITVFAKEPSYDTLMQCVKDWITQANSGHRDRMTQPKNVQFGRPS